MCRNKCCRNIYKGEQKILKEISSHSRGKPSTVSGDSRGYLGDRLPIMDVPLAKNPFNGNGSTTAFLVLKVVLHAVVVVLEVLRLSTKSRCIRCCRAHLHYPLVGPHCQTFPHYWGRLCPILWRMDGPPSASLACPPSCTPRLKGAGNLALHIIAHIESWARLCTPPTQPEAGPFVVVALAGSLSLLEPLWGRWLGSSPPSAI